MLSLMDTLVHEKNKTKNLIISESALTDHSKLEDLFLGLTLTRVKLSIPKFRISSEFTVRAPLSELGITKAFDSNVADFTGIDPSGEYFTHFFKRGRGMDVIK